MFDVSLNIKLDAAEIEQNEKKKIRYYIKLFVEQILIIIKQMTNNISKI